MFLSESSQFALCSFLWVLLKEDHHPVLLLFSFFDLQPLPLPSSQKLVMQSPTQILHHTLALILCTVSHTPHTVFVHCHLVARHSSLTSSFHSLFANMCFLTLCAFVCASFLAVGRFAFPRSSFLQNKCQKLFLHMLRASKSVHYLICLRNLTANTIRFFNSSNVFLLHLLQFPQP